jgi:membrane-bound metal-dependent hydrolase YbcI (DUF457 family)
MGLNRPFGPTSGMVTDDMPSSPAHAMFALALGSAWVPRPALRVFLIAGAGCALLPDIDLLAALFGVGSREVHRTFTHSVFFAVLLGLVAAICAKHFMSSKYTGRLAGYVAVATASHSVFDALATYDMGVVFLSPLSSHRYVVPRARLTPDPLNSASS